MSYIRIFSVFVLAVTLGAPFSTRSARGFEVLEENLKSTVQDSVPLDSGIGASLNRWLARHYKNLSGTVRVSINGETVASMSGGWAKNQGSSKLPNTAQTLFPIASVTKTFTAALIWKQIAEGRLSLDTRVSKFIPFDFPDQRFASRRAFWEGITIGSLLNHTSGLRDHVNAPAWLIAVRDDWSVDRIVSYVQTLRPRLGKECANENCYSNAGFSILGRVLEILSSSSLADILKREIFTPLRLDHTGVFETNRLDDRFAFPGGGKEADTTKELREPPLFFASGDLYSTAEELDEWAKALFVRRTVIPADTVTKLWASAPSAPHFRTEGLTLRGDDRYHIVYKTGHLPSYSNNLAYVPEYGITIVVLQNEPDSLGKRVFEATRDIVAQTIQLIRRSSLPN